MSEHKYENVKTSINQADVSPTWIQRKSLIVSVVMVIVLNREALIG